MFGEKWHVISETFPKPTSWFVRKKLNLTQQEHAFHNQNKCTPPQNKHRKLKPGLVANYDIWSGNRMGLFLFQRFINLSLTCLFRHLPTYLQSQDPHGTTGSINHQIFTNYLLPIFNPCLCLLSNRSDHASYHASYRLKQCSYA